MFLLQKLLALSLFLLHVIPASSLPSEPSPGISASKACDGLQNQLGSVVVQTSGTEYLQVATNAWNFFNTVQRPACIALPRNASHVQLAMKAIFKAKVRYAVQAGSHSAMKGWNNVDGGVLISFSHMTNVSYDAQKDTITLQPGIHWGDALAQLELLGVAPMGGRIGDVGTGLLLGGGLSYLAGEHGFSADAYTELDVVLVNGDMVTATATNHYSDLFRALKGGANRFGLVTRYEVSAVHTGTNEEKNFFGGLIIYPNSSIEAVVRATANYVRTVNDPKASLLVVVGNAANNGVLTSAHAVALFYHGSELPTSIFGELLSIPSSTSILGPVSYVEAAGILGPGADRGNGEFFGASTFNGDVDQYLDAFNNWSNFTNTFKNDINGTVLAFTPVLDSQIAAGRARGGNAIDPPQGSYAYVQFMTQMPLNQITVPAELERGRQLLLRQMPRSPGLPLYINECDAGQNVFATYGGYEFLKDTYAKYDPTRFNVKFTQGPIGL